MIRSDKQASLSSTLLAAKKAAPVAAEARTPALSLVPPTPVENVNDEAEAAAPAEPENRETLLFSKGAASAAGFRPSYWSYERPPQQTQAPDADHQTPPLATPAPSPITHRATKQTVQWAVIGFGCLAVLISARPLFFGHAPSPLKPAAVAPAPVAAPAVKPAPTPAAAPVSAPPKAVATKPAPGPAAPDEKVLVRRLENDNLLSRGNAYLTTGDIVSARLFYERAASAGDGRAALALAETYDPSFLHRLGVLGVRGDLARATHWYERARDLGETAAAAALLRLQAK